MARLAPVPDQWRTCSRDDECAVFGERCGGFGYNKKFQKEVEKKLKNNFLCKQLRWDLKFKARCIVSLCDRIIVPEKREKNE
jgi:hypothetical protein